jgi:hypothetical protein
MRNTVPWTSMILFCVLGFPRPHFFLLSLTPPRPSITVAGIDGARADQEGCKDVYHSIVITLFHTVL